MLAVRAERDEPFAHVKDRVKVIGGGDSDEHQMSS
jgi:hypothetical protein